jgi:Ser/Thr protein kinase RdoA (MazF antagonist)
MIDQANAFALRGKPASCTRYGFGHINETYLLTTDEGHVYILQKINRRVFNDVPALMGNIAAVTQHLARANADPRRVLTLCPTLAGEPFHTDDIGECWRVYTFITGSVCLQQAQSAADFYQSGHAFGQFQTLLADFPAETLAETIPRFHDTPHRYTAFRSAMADNAAGRAAQARREVDFALVREAEAGSMVAMQRSGALPLRVTHNDTKLNNVMLDVATREALCVIDLDTVMPGLAGNDFGDSIRFGATTAAEDEPDLALVRLSLPLYEAYAKGFLGACGERLTPAEIDTLPLAAKLMTLECGVRFLTDYLCGDVYFHTVRPGQNLDRARTQFKLVAEMERHWQQMADIVGASARERGA